MKNMEGVKKAGKPKICKWFKTGTSQTNSHFLIFMLYHFGFVHFFAFWLADGCHQMP